MIFLHCLNFTYIFITILLENTFFRVEEHSVIEILTLQQVSHYKMLYQLGVGLLSISFI